METEVVSFTGSLQDCASLATMLCSKLRKRRLRVEEDGRMRRRHMSEEREKK